MISGIHVWSILELRHLFRGLLFYMILKWILFYMFYAFEMLPSPPALWSLALLFNNLWSPASVHIAAACAQYITLGSLFSSPHKIFLMLSWYPGNTAGGQYSQDVKISDVCVLGEPEIVWWLQTMVDNISESFLCWMSSTCSIAFM